MALFDIIKTKELSFDENERRLTERYFVRAPFDLALQAPALPARGDITSFQGRALRVVERSISRIERSGVGAGVNPADGLIEIVVAYGPATTGFSGGSPIDTTSPDFVDIRGTYEPDDLEIPYHIVQTARVETAPGTITVIAQALPRPAVYERTRERIEVEVYLENLGAAHRAIIEAQRGTLHALDLSNFHYLFEGATYSRAPQGQNIWQLRYTWLGLKPLDLGAPEQFIVKPTGTLPPFARWEAIPGDEIGEGPLRRRGLPTFVVTGLRPQGNAALLPGNPLQYLLNGVPPVGE